MSVLWKGRWEGITYPVLISRTRSIILLVLDLLGIFANNPKEIGTCYLEHTKDRPNISTPCLKKDIHAQEHIPTNWLLTDHIGKNCPATKDCSIIDDTHMTHYTHKY